MVGGSVTYGSSAPRPFTQTFVLTVDDAGNFYAINDCFRLNA
jgi:hypothetical protein